jgi:carbon monoxide dehydrogenase subunit G
LVGINRSIKHIWRYGKMANKNFVVQHGLTVGPLTIDAATGDINTSGNVVITGNLGLSKIAKNDSSVSITDTGSGSSVTINIDGTTEHTVDADGVNLASGDRFAIAGDSVLNATTLGANVVNSSLTSVGNLTILNVDGDATVQGNLTVHGLSTLNGGTLTLGDSNIWCRCKQQCYSKYRFNLSVR